MLVGVIGRKGAGKDVVGAYLVIVHGFQRVAYADNVKRVARVLFPHLAVEQLWGPIEVKEAVDPVTGVTPRWLLQTIGTEIGREGQLDALAGLGVSSSHVTAALACYAVVPGPRAWIASLFKTIGMGNYVVTDVRFPNEAVAIQSVDGYVLKLVRPGYDTGAFNDHPSETEVDNCPFDFEVVNDATVEALHQKISALITPLQGLP